MRILYDATPLLMRSAGVKHYHHTLLRTLIPQIDPHQIGLFPFLDTLTANRPDLSNYPPYPTMWRLGAVLGSNYSGWNLAQPAARKSQLFHVTPHVWQLPSNKCLTSMVHDPTPLLLPRCHTESNVRYFKQFVKGTLPRLHRMIVPSKAVANDLVQRLRVPPDRISVIYHGVEPEFYEVTSAASYVATQRYKLPNDYILFVGTMEPRKNLVRLGRSYKMLPEDLRRQHPLVIVGATGWDAAPIRRELSSIPGVHLVGPVRRSLLPAIYHGASMFVLPSLYEGFGLPIVEAMAARLPIVTSNTGAAPEIVGAAGLCVDPMSISDLAAAMERVLSDQDTATSLGAAGRERVRSFTWDKTAVQTKAFFEAALGGTSDPQSV